MSSYGTAATTNQDRPYQGFPYTNPTIIDVPSVERQHDQWANLPRKQLSPNPKTIVEIPRDPTDDHNDGVNSSGFVSDTILYNQFEDRTIDINKEQRNNDRDKKPTRSHRSSTSSENEIPRIYVPPIPQDDFDFGGSSRGRERPQLVIPPFMNKEASIYQPGVDDGFSLSPIPVSEFPEPPPAYSEIDRGRQPRGAQRTENAAPNEAPRTQVILQPRVTERPRQLNNDRQQLKCPHCDKQVNTIVIREAGMGTHLAALIFFLLILFPITILIYCTDFCKYKNHYCPDCNKLVGYEIPITGQEFVYAERHP